MIAERRGCRYNQTIGLVLVEFSLPGNRVVFSFRIGDLGTKILEPHAYRSITVLETGRDKTMLHLGHFGPDRDHKPISGPGRKHRVPGTSHSFINRTWPENIGCSATSNQNRLGLENVKFILPYSKPNRSCDTLWVISIGQ